jgi:ribosome-associated protein
LVGSVVRQALAGASFAVAKASFAVAKERVMRISSSSQSKAMAAAAAASAKKASDIVILEVGSLIGLTDYFVICTGNNERQVQTIADSVSTELAKMGVKAYRREGWRESRWVLLDFLDVVVHVFHPEERRFYRLENLWQDAPRVDFEEGEVAAQGA